MTSDISALGAIIGLLFSVFLIFKKVTPVYSLISGAILGGLIGGASLTRTVEIMIVGVQGISPAILRILAAGVLAGVLIESGSTIVIAERIIKQLGESKALLALSIAAMILTASGVFLDVVIITISPIALSIAQKAGFSRSAILLAMMGGAKAGNIISPNPNSIAIAEAFDIPLSQVMLGGIIPALFGLAATYFMAKRTFKSGSYLKTVSVKEVERVELSFIKAMSPAGIAIFLLMLRPLAGIEIDPIIALPLGGVIGCLIIDSHQKIIPYSEKGLLKMSGVALILLGTGTLAGIVSHSGIGEMLIQGIEYIGLPVYMLAPISGILMGAATASTTSGSSIAGSVFSDTIVNSGISAVGGAVMIHTGATVIDMLPHGSIFHASSGPIDMTFKERLRLIPYEATIAMVTVVVATLIYGLLKIM